MASVNALEGLPASDAERSLGTRASELCDGALNELHRSADRMFLWLLLAQWVFGLVLALVISPRTWSGSYSEIHPNVYVAAVLGGVINILPISLILLRPGAASTRNSIAIAQMLWSALFIHLTHGRIETHFHVFGSLAFLAFYRDTRVLVIATLTVALDHYLRGSLWPESIYGTLAPEQWRFLEHAGWVVFETFVLILSCNRALDLYREVAVREARLERTKFDVERQVVERTEQLRAEIVVRQEREEELHRAQFAAEAANRAKSQFLANMSHEIRTPMNGVLGFTNLLLDTPLNGEQREHVRTIRHSGEALLSIINDILDFSKVEAGKLTVEHISFDLRRAAEEVAELLAAQAYDKGLEISLSFDPKLPDEIEGDPGRVRQILTNLIGNAIKFTRAGHVLIDIAVLSAESNSGRDEVRCSVTDTGIGISEEKHALLFREFSQADGSMTRQFGGTGLGLAISRGLVELMGGRIGFTSAVGKGACFWFTLPCAAAMTLNALVALNTARMRVLKPSSAIADPAKPSLPGIDASLTPIERVVPIESASQLRVLVAEDNKVNQRLAKRMFEKLGCRVDIAVDGREAVAAATRLSYDVVFMDCSMPEMDGFQATIELRRRETGGRRVPIIALTANALAEDRARCLAAGMDDYLSKPVRIEEIQKALTRWAPQPERTLVAPSRA